MLRGLSKVECHNVYNTLACIPFILLGKGTMIDLRNETSVAGRIVDVDGYMNITLNEVVFIDQRRQLHAFDNFMVPARNIKYIHIPKEIKVEPSMQAFFAGTQAQPRKQKSGRTFKIKRAQQNHLATLRDIAEQRQQSHTAQRPAKHLNCSDSNSKTA